MRSATSGRSCRAWHGCRVWRDWLIVTANRSCCLPVLGDGDWLSDWVLNCWLTTSNDKFSCAATHLHLPTNESATHAPAGANVAFHTRLRHSPCPQPHVDQSRRHKTGRGRERRPTGAGESVSWASVYVTSSWIVLGASEWLRSAYGEATSVNACAI